MATCHYDSCGRDFSGVQGQRYCTDECLLLAHLEDGKYGGVTPRQVYLRWLKLHGLLAIEGRVILEKEAEGGPTS